MKRIYHPYWLWEDYKAGFYNNCSGETKITDFEIIKDSVGCSKDY